MANEIDSVLTLLRDVVRVLDEKKAADLRVLRVSEQSSITDFLVVATGTSEPHLRALRIELEKVLDSRGARIAGMDTGEPGSGWIVVDAYQIMVHLFTAEKREAYRLENLWKDAAEVNVGDLLNPEAPAKPARAPRVRSPRKSPAKKVASTRKPARSKAAKPMRKPARRKKSG